MRKLCRTALLSAMALVCLQPSTLFVPRAAAGAVPAAASRGKKKNKYKKRKQKVLKGRHGKHTRKAA
jgi:hypothetical protein